MTRDARAAMPRRVPRDRDHDPIEQSYDRFLNGTRADCLALLSFILVVRAKIPFLAGLENPWLAPLLGMPLLAGPCLAALLGLAFTGHDFRSVLRGRSSWSNAIAWSSAVGVIGFSLHTLLIYGFGKTVSAPLTSDFDLAAQIGVLVVLSPVIEEFIFQVVVQTRLRRLGTVTSIVVTTLAFTLFHLRSLDHLPPTGMLFAQIPLFFGLLGFAVMRHYNGSVAGLIAAHALSNVLAIEVDPYLAARF